jgi:hypothetical protein
MKFLFRQTAIPALRAGKKGKMGLSLSVGNVTGWVRANPAALLFGIVAGARR